MSLRRAGHRAQRLRLTWLLALPFFLLATPSRGTVLAGSALSLCGLLLRGFACGSILKDRTLAVGGPYAHLRHPLYLGSFLVGAGLTMAGGRWFFPPLFLALFLWVYGRTIRAEERVLEILFGKPYRDYRARVRGFIPRLHPYRPPGGPESWESARVSGSGFSLRLFRRNKEWQASLGTAAGFVLLWVKAVLMGPG